MNQLLKNVNGSLFAVSLCFFSTSTVAETSSPGMPGNSTHLNYMSIATAAALLAIEGENPIDWKQVRYFPGYYCYPSPVPMPEPIDSTGDYDETEPGHGGAVPSCLGEVYFTKQYSLVECADGSTHIVRSGSGVSLDSISTGQTFQWAEGVVCSVTSPVPPPSTPVTNVGQELLDKNLDRSKLEILD